MMLWLAFTFELRGGRDVRENDLKAKAGSKLAAVVAIKKALGYKGPRVATQPMPAATLGSGGARGPPPPPPPPMS